MVKTSNHTDSLKAVQDLLKKIARLNESIASIEALDPTDDLSVQGLKRYKSQLTKDLTALLAEFGLKIKVESQAA
ncbi:MAG: hypothetical protein H6577_24745 [Lewinellaceae bacterium]|nr:hypothetical protein [Saprospiraceae bacterium]MCB9341345.1 hypothetical protein [Lewinellaceae bacterium]